jgi:hypothetical protein
VFPSQGNIAQAFSVLSFDPAVGIRFRLLLCVPGPAKNTVAETDRDFDSRFGF